MDQPRSTQTEIQVPLDIIPEIEYDEDESDLLPPPILDEYDEEEDPNNLEPGRIYIDPHREKWAFHVESILCIVGFAVDIETISQFPALCSQFGGLAFVIPYLFCVIFGAFPVLYMELILGQFVQQGIISVWKIVPIFRGLGYCMQMILLLVSMYYITSLAWSVIFMYEAWFSESPWNSCDNLWNTDDCILISQELVPTAGTKNHSTLSGKEFFRGRILTIYQSQYADADAGIDNRSDNGHKKFGLTSELGIGSPTTDSSFCLLFIFLLAFVMLLKGIRLSGKIVWLTITIPSIILALLLFRGLTLPGGSIGVKTLLKPNWSILTDPQAWTLAALLAFFSMGGGFGVHMTIASHNEFHTNILRDCIIAAIMNVFTAICSTIIVIAVLGFFATSQRKKPEDVVHDALGLPMLFEIYPDAVGRLSAGSFYIFIFYLMIFLNGFDTWFVGMYAFTQGSIEEFKLWFPNDATTRGICICALVALTFLANLFSLTRGGIWIYVILETFATGTSYMMSVFLQIVVVSWIWGLEDLCKAAKVMTGHWPGFYFRFCWKFLSPTLVLLVIIVQLTGPREAVVVDGEKAPRLANIIGNIINFLPISCVPAYIIYQLLHHGKGKNFCEKCRLLLCPENEHEEIIATGTAGKRLTLSHFLYFGAGPTFQKPSFMERKGKVGSTLPNPPETPSASKVPTPTVSVSENKQTNNEVQGLSTPSVADSSSFSIKEEDARAGSNDPKTTAKPTDISTKKKSVYIRKK